MPLRFVLVCALVSARLMAQPMDLLLINGNIHTLDAARPRVEAVGVIRGRIEFIGSTSEADPLRREARKVIDLGGKTVVPGLNDAHMHLAGVGFRELTFNLQGTKSVADLQEKLRERIEKAPAKKWITGRGWIETHWEPAEFPTAKDLDAVAPNHPVALERADGHALVANSLALKIAGVTRDTPNPSGGEVIRDAAGEPTGVLVDNAMQLVERLVPPPTRAELEHALIVGARRQASLGWTAVQIAGNSLEESELIHRLVRRDDIKIRIYDAVIGTGDGLSRLWTRDVAIGEVDGRFTRRGVKTYIDGALGSRGAALLEPYSDYASKGLVMQDEAKLRHFLEDALRSGVQVQTHAIGDHGNRLILDLYEKVFAAVPPEVRKVAEPRWRIEHAQVLHSDDIPRFARLGVIASMQPSHAIGDLFFAPARLGKDRLAGAYAWQSLLKSGAKIAAGTDAPVERGEPMIEFYAAVARRSLDGFASDDWHLEQRMTREQALRAMTIDAAFAAFEENDCGTITRGKRADFTVLSADIMTIPESEILKTRCEMTIVGGKIVFESSASR